MDLLGSIGVEDITMFPGINTGTLIDIATGTYEKHDKSWILNGGILPITGIAGRGGYYKTGLADSIIGHVLSMYPDSQAIKLDTEQNSFNKNRIVAVGGDIANRVKLLNLSTTGSSEFVEILKTLTTEKEKHKKDYMVETPFIDDNTGKNLKMWIPTIITIDSWTCFRSTTEENIITTSKDGVESSDLKMTDMQDGMMKRKLMFLLSKWAYKYGLYFILTAQVDDEIEMNQYAIKAKQNQFLKQADRLKSVGPQFEFLTNLLFQNLSPSPLLDSSKKEALYQSKNDTNLEVDRNEVMVKVLRSKTNTAGMTIPMIFSQSKGDLKNLTNYHYLVQNEDFGFNVKQYNRYSLFHPDVLLQRKTVIDTLNENYELSRGIEILAHLKWILKNWNVGNFVSMNIPTMAEDLVNGLLNNKSIKMEDILNSRGYWTYNKKDPRKYLSLFDIISLLNKK